MLLGRRMLLVCLAVIWAAGCEDKPGPARGPATGGAKTDQPPIRLSAGVALPQTGPDGTLMSFSVDYRLVQGDPAPEYVWVIERAKGVPARQKVKLGRQGNLPILLPGWRPEEGPFHTHIEDGAGKRLSESLPLR